MRLIGLVLLAAALAGGCDRGSEPTGQGEAAANRVTPDEAPPSAPAATQARFDRSNKGETAPDLAFTDPEGKRVTLADYRGRPVLLNLWATWCGPCVRELPTLDALAKREAGRLTVITLSQDMEPAKATAYLKQRGFASLRSWTDPAMAWTPAVASTLPTTILYDAQGREVLRRTGDLDWAGAEARAAISEAG